MHLQTQKQRDGNSTTELYCAVLIRWPERRFYLLASLRIKVGWIILVLDISCGVRMKDLVHQILNYVGIRNVSTKELELFKEMEITVTVIIENKYKLQNSKQTENHTEQIPYK